MIAPSYQLWFAVRYVHVASVALLLGGAAILCALCFSSGPRGFADAVISAASLYEWMFWSLAGVAAVTGVSNLGLKGDGLIGPATTWGRALTTKLAAVLLLLAVSLVRSEVAVRCGSADDAAAPRRAPALMGALYGVTAVLLLGALWLGLGLAHGRY